MPSTPHGEETRPRPRGPGSWRRRLDAAWVRLAANRRVRGEISWVILNKGIEFGLMFVLLKVLSNQLGKAGYGEYNLAETAVLLTTSVVIMPVHESYLRDFHGARERGEGGAADLAMLGWHAGVSLLAVVLAALIGERVGEWLGIGRWTVMAASLVFACERWRFLGQDILNIQRRRRAWALSNLGYAVTKVCLISAAVSWGEAITSTALFAYAASAAIFALFVTGPRVLEILRRPRGASGRFWSVVRSFGVPLAFLLVFQWIQSFSDRYLVSLLLDAESVGLYVAAFQVCGIPYTLALRISHNLLTPIAYQRGRDLGDPAQLWSADRMLLAGLAVQLVFGMALLCVYALIGPQLLVLLTNEGYSLSVGMLLLLAAGRLVQSLAQGLQPIFAVHHRLGSMLWFRLAGAGLTLGICWTAIRAYGITGAAAGSLVALSLYLAGLVFGPGGCFWFVAEARRETRSAAARARVS